jgi:hypothetical protein
VSGFQGTGSRNRVGPLAQRELLVLLKALVDASRAKSASRTRDEARAALRATLDTAHWNTPWLRHNLGVRRMKVIARMGYQVPYDALVPRGLDGLERLDAKRRG